MLFRRIGQFLGLQLLQGADNAEALHESSGCAERTGETGILNDSQMTSYAKNGCIGTDYTPFFRRR